MYVQVVHLDSALLPRDYFMFFPILCIGQYIADLDECETPELTVEEMVS